MAFIQNTLTDLDDLLITISTAQGRQTTTSVVSEASTEFDTTSTIVITADITSSGFQQGDFIQVSGALTSANNVLFEISSVSFGATTTITAVGTPFVADGTPGTQTLTRVAGAQAQTLADITFTANTVVSAGGTFETGFQDGSFVQISGAADSQNNIIAQITSGEGTGTLTFGSSPFKIQATQANVTITKVNHIEFNTAEVHGLNTEKFIRGTAGTFTTTTFQDTGINFVDDGLAIGQTVIINESPDVANNEGRELLITDITTTTNPNDTLTFDVEGTNLTAGGGGTAATTILRRQYVTITNCSGYNGRYIPRQTAASSISTADTDFYFTVAVPVSTNSKIDQEVTGEAFGDNNNGIYSTPEIEIDARSGVQTFQLRNAGNLTVAGSGVAGQALYSLFKERWKEVPGLTKFDFPMLSITNEQFEFINNWVPKDDTTRKMIRTAGWAERTAPTAIPPNTIIREYAGIISLGSLGNTDQPYFVQDDATNAAILETDFTGPVNEAVLDYLSVTASALDDIEFVGEKEDTGLVVDFPNGTSTLVLNAGTFTNLDDLVAGDIIQIAGSDVASNNRYYEVVSSNGTTEIVVKTEVFAQSLADAGVTISRVPGIRSTNTRLDYFAVGSVLNIGNAGPTNSNFEGKVQVTDNSGYYNALTEGGYNYFLEIKYEDPASPALSDAGSAWQTETSTTTAAGTHLLFDQRTTFKIFVRERGKTYADSELVDIGVSQMTYIVYRFPVSNATDLDINTTNDNAIVGFNIGYAAADPTNVTVHSASASYDDLVVAAAATPGQYTITSAGSTNFDIFSPGHEITVSGDYSSTYSGVSSQGGGPTQDATAFANAGGGAPDMSDNFGTFTIAATASNQLTVSGGAMSPANSYTGWIHLVEEHGLYVGAPTIIGDSEDSNFNTGFTVNSVIDGRSYTVPKGSLITAGETIVGTASNGRLQYIGHPASTYIDLEYFEDTYSGLEILGPWSVSTVVNEANISIDGATVIDDSSSNRLQDFMPGSYLLIHGQNNPATDGVTIINPTTGAETILGNLNNVDDNGATLTSALFPGTSAIILNSNTNGEAKAYRIASVAADGNSLTLDVSIGELSAAAIGNVHLYQYFDKNAVVQSTEGTPLVNSKWYRVSTAGVTTVAPHTELSIQTSGGTDDYLLTYNGYFGTSDMDDDAGINPQGDHGASFQVEADQKSAYRVVLDTNSDAGNTGADGENEAPTATKEIVYEWSQWALRQSGTIDSPAVGVTPSDPRRIGKIADALVTFVGDTLETSQGVFVADIATVDVNNIRFYDYNNATHVFPLEVLVTINFNDNLNGQTDSAVFYAYYTTLPSGNDFGTNDAVQVNRSTPAGQLPVGSDVTNAVPASSVYTFNYAYASDTADGTRTGNTDQNITVVAIGLFNGQYVKASGDITENGATISLVAPLERNYTDPNG